MDKLPISVVIVSCNEGHLLNDCLMSVLFCNEIIVVDLESSDNSIEIASQYPAKIIHHPRVPIVEYIRKWVVDKVSFDWILFVDPDEVYTSSLQEAIITEFTSISPEVGSISLPIQFLFRGMPLKGGVWGGDRYKTVLINRFRNHFNEFVHEDIVLSPGFFQHKINCKDAYIEHYWMQSFSELFEKHRRYLKEEGRKMFEQGKRYSLFRHLYHTLNAFRHSFFLKQGYKDGFTGLFLSLFWCWYIAGCWSSLLRYENTQ